LLQIPLQMQQNDNPEDGAHGMGCPGARERLARPAAGLVHRAYATDTRFT
jgi:hypothetical protein